MARFAQYAMVASEEALKDAEWDPKKEEDLAATVSKSKLLSCTLYSRRPRVFTWVLVLAAWMMFMILQWHTRKV